MPGSRRGRVRNRKVTTSSFVSISVEQGEQFKHLTRQLKDAGRGDLRKGLNRNIKDAGKPVVHDVQRAVRHVRVSSSQGGHAPPDKSTHLRERVARATGVSVTQKGIQIKVSAKKVGEYGHTLPRYLDASFGSYKKWRHPVFGNKENWVKQQGQPYFGKTIKKHTRDFRKAINKAMDDVADDITE